MGLAARLRHADAPAVVPLGQRAEFDAVCSSLVRSASERENRIHLDDASHTYTLDDSRRLAGLTSTLSTFCHAFDAAAQARQCALFARVGGKYHGMSEEDILRDWGNRRDARICCCRRH